MEPVRHAVSAERIAHAMKSRLHSGIQDSLEVSDATTLSRRHYFRTSTEISSWAPVQAAKAAPR